MTALQYLAKNWERILFALVGLACLGFGFIFLSARNVTAASAVFAIGFFSFFYSNLARFKRFKGFGFEAELWEDKQKEAADLIDRLKNVVSIYSREVVMSQVMRGRMSKGPNWQRNWALFDELVAQHGELRQAIDFSDLKRQVDRVFLFDMTYAQASILKSAFQTASSEVYKLIQREHPNPIRDSAGHSARLAQQRAITFGTKDMLQDMAERNVPRALISDAQTAAQAFERDFGVIFKLDEMAIQNLEKIAGWYDAGPLVITSEMIALAEQEQTF